ncbi:MAG: response regulator [candidate division Zixibacteria bacterium]|nr:response regulator [candidate division Zixibacteria bacterium]
MEYKVLLVDDDIHVLDGLEILLEDTFPILRVSSGHEAIDAIKKGKSVAVVVMDIKMPEMDGITAARLIHENDPDIPIIFHTGFPGQYSESEIDASEKPYEYIEKGESSIKLIRAIRNAYETFLAKIEVEKLSLFAEQSYGIIGKSEPMRKVYQIINKVAQTDTKAIILGETGTGKELVAWAIHNHSERRESHLVVFNCNHRPPDLVESELFGHGRGAFTGAVTDKIGLFEYADGGTVFLDEIGDLDITTQGKILRVLETGEFQTVGKTPRLKQSDVRILCATNKNLVRMVEQKQFREDLFYRLKGVVINLPPLRERKEDIPILVTRFCDQITIEQDRMPVYFDKSAIRALLDYDWPGNVRQLKDTIESLITLLESDIIFGSDIEAYLGREASGIQSGSDGNGLTARTREFRRNCIIEALHETNNNVNAAARLLKVDASNLRKWINGYNITLP